MNIGVGVHFKIEDLHFVNRDYNFKRRHLSDLVKSEWGFVKRVKRGVYVIPEEIMEIYQRYKEESGELETEENELAKTIRRRISFRYVLAVERAIAEGNDPDEVPVPEDMPKSEGVRILERAGKKEEERRKSKELTSLLFGN